MGAPGRQHSARASADRGHGAVASQVAESKDHWIGNRIVDEVSGALPAHQSSLPQRLEVFRHVGLAGMQGRHDFIDGAPPALQGVENAQARGLCQQAEPFRGEFDLLRRDRRGLHGLRSLLSFGANSA